MDKERIVKMALASGFNIELLADGSEYVDSRIFKLSKHIESAIAHEYEEKRKKDVLALVALRSEVAVLAKDNERLRGLVTDAVSLLSGGESDD